MGKKTYVILFVLMNCYYSKNICSVTIRDMDCDKKALHDSRIKNGFEIQADADQFAKDDLRSIPFAVKLREDCEEVYFLVEKTTAIPIGIVSFAVEHESASIEKLGIHQDYQRKGHGKRLMEYALNLLKKRGIKTVSVISTVDGIDFYRKNGFSFGKMGSLERKP
jgi:ribosomal protein S18 acetylase RimI-like enzyme